MTTSIAFPTLLETFFTDRLLRQKQVSPHTVASYRDTFSLLRRFTRQRLGKAPSALTLDDLDAPVVSTFLDHLEHERGTSARSRNVRLAAIHSFFHYAALRAPSHSGLIQRVLAIPSKRYDRTPIAFLTNAEIDGLVAAPDQQTWTGRRDRTLLLLAVQTGLRVSEMTGLCWQDVTLGAGAHVRCQGKGRKERCTPLRKDTITALRAWQREQQSRPEESVFPSSRGGPLSRDGVAYLLAKHVGTAQQQCPSLQAKQVSPHVLRHYVDFWTMSRRLQKRRLRRRPTWHLRDIVRGCYGGPGVESRTDLVEARGRKRYASGIRRSYPSFSVSSSVPNRRSGDLRTMSSGRVSILRASI
jgi:site-specific recombinase XerD